MTVRRYDGATSSFVQAEYQGQMPCFRYDSTSGRWLDQYLTDGLIAYWSMETVHTDTGTLLDASGNAHDGTLKNGVTTGQSGTIGQSYEFDGTDDYVSAATVGLEVFTIAGWIYRRSDNSYDALSSQGDASNGTRNWWFGGNNNSNNNALFSLQDSGNNYNLISSTGSLPTDTWTHITGIYDGADMQIYIDGSFDAAQTINTTPVTSDSLGAIGAGKQGSDFHFDGYATDVRVYDRALSEAELTALYKQGLQP
jgi:hypothetical protein